MIAGRRVSLSDALASDGGSKRHDAPLVRGEVERGLDEEGAEEDEVQEGADERGALASARVQFKHREQRMDG